MNKSRATETVLTITLGLLVLYIIQDKTHAWILYAALFTGVMGLLWKWLRIQIHYFWFWLAGVIGYVTSRIILGIVFFLVVVPFGLLARIFRKDLMFMKGGKNSYYISRNHRYTGDDLENQW